jgi:hypothetical protein
MRLRWFAAPLIAVAVSLLGVVPGVTAIEVTSVQVDATAAAGSSISYAMTTSLPLSGRDFRLFACLVPGSAPADDFSVRQGGCTEARNGAGASGTIRGLGAGSYTLRFTNVVNSTALPGYYGPNGAYSPTIIGAPRVTLRAGQQLHIALTPQIPSNPLTAGGTVVSSSGTGLAGVTVDLCASDDPQVCTETSTAADGSFTAPLPGDRPYLLEVRTKSGSNEFRGSWYGPAGKSVFDARQAAIIQPGTTTPFRFEVGTGHSWIGALKSTTGTPIAGATMSACPDSGDCFMTTTDKTGRFLLSGLPPVALTLGWTRPLGTAYASGGWPNARQPNDGFTFGGGDSFLATGSQYEPIVTFDHDVTSNIQAGIDPYAIRVRVMLPGGRPAAGIDLTACTPMYRHKSVPAGCEDSTTNSQGIASIAVPDLGQYIVGLRPSFTFNFMGGYIGAAGKFVTRFSQAQQVELGSAVFPSISNLYPARGATNVARSVTVRFTAIDAPCSQAFVKSVHLRDDATGLYVPIRVNLACRTDLVTVLPTSPLAGARFSLELVHTFSSSGRPYPDPNWHFTTSGSPPPSPTFTVSLRPSYATSPTAGITGYGCVATSPAQGGAPFVDTIALPDGSTSSQTGALDAAGRATVTFSIPQNGVVFQQVKVSVGTVSETAAASMQVYGAAGPPGCP